MKKNGKRRNKEEKNVGTNRRKMEKYKEEKQRNKQKNGETNRIKDEGAKRMQNGGRKGRKK